MENIIEIIYFIAAIAVSAVFIYVMANGFFLWTKKGTVPVITVTAAVSGKSIGEAANDFEKIKAPNEYFATFVNSQGAEKELRITESEYKALVVGISGTLAYRGDVMLSFDAAASCLDKKEVETNEE